MKEKFFLLVFLGFGLFAACKKKEFKPSEAFEPVLAAGENCTVYDETSLAFSYRINGLNSQQKLDFFVGNSFFNQNWVESPSSTTARDGLGPLYNTKSCSSCHFRDGRGEPTSGQGILLRLSVPGGGIEPVYGGQFQDYSISTASGEGDLSITYAESAGQYTDGTPYSLRFPIYDMINLNYGAMSPDVMVSPRVGGQIIGLGLLELIPESSILSNADASDVDGDGISGRANYVFDPFYNATVIGRFGWKANTGSIPVQVAAAFNGDLGIKSPMFPNENHTSNQSVLDALPNGGDPEIIQDDLDKVTLYCRTLGVPIRRNQGTPEVMRGRNIFRSLQCNKCHIEDFTTGNSGSIEPLKNTVIHPYTDLLLHDMGADLSDNRPDGLATGNEWRTPPLWGLGLIETVNGHTFLLHDGRARTIEEAILWHGGEAQQSKNAFLELSLTERQDLISFLKSL